MNITLDNRKARGRVRVIESKSFAHRIMICAALSKMMTGEDTRILMTGTSQDMDATKSVLSAIERREPLLDCGESGTTLRLILPVCAALGRMEELRFTGHGRLMKRPMGPLIEAMSPHGASVLFEEESSCLVLKGKLKAGAYEIAADVSSQYISGLLFALPLLDGDSTLKLKGKVESRPYIDITIDVIKGFGIEIDEIPEEGIFKIKGNQVYKSPETIQVEGDWSNGAFWLALGAVSNEPVRVEGLNLKSIQGDRKICQVLEAFGAEITELEEDNAIICTSGGRLKGIEISAADIPDLVPVISVVASVAEGDTLIKDGKRLRLKESDRIESTAAMIRSLGAEVDTGEDYMIIHGKGGPLEGGTVDGANDHRIVMSAAVAASACSGPVTIKGWQAVNKSYPGFFEEREKLLCPALMEKN